MSWLKNTSFSFNRPTSRILDPNTDYEPSACYNSFCNHWQQAYQIISLNQPGTPYHHDDVLAVVNHLEHLATLIQLEAKARELTRFASNTNTNPPTCLEYLLSDNVLDKLYEWAPFTGKYLNAVRLEQLKLCHLLASNYGELVLGAEPFLRPLLKLLATCRNEILPSVVEGQLVQLLSQLCVVLMQNTNYVDLFFLSTPLQNGSTSSEFILARLLLNTVHRTGSSGALSRDALLLCACVSAKHQPLADYMLASNLSVVLATGLSGLYSRLPRSLASNGSHRLVPDDVIALPNLALFIDSLEFCNAVAQVAHPSIRVQLLDYLYQGFLVPVLGPALLQGGSAGTAGTETGVTATAVAEASARALGPRGALPALLKFLVTHRYEGHALIDLLVRRIAGNHQLSLVTMALLETLLDLNCEDVMLELVLKYLIDVPHLLPSQRRKITNSLPYKEAAMEFLKLAPKCCSRPLTRTKEWADRQGVTFKRLHDGKTVDVDRSSEQSIPMNILASDVRFSYGLDPNESLLANYHAYMCDSRRRIRNCILSCSTWSSKYDARHLCESSEEPKLSEMANGDCYSKEHDSLTSIGESSGYESFKYRIEGDFAMDDAEDETTKDEYSELSFVKEIALAPTPSYGDESAFSTYEKRPNINLGLFMTILLDKVYSLLESDLNTTLYVTGLISSIACYPTPVSMSLLLCHSFVLQPTVPSLFQILRRLKAEIDDLCETVDNVSSLVDEARIYLVHREMTIVNHRRQALSEGKFGANSESSNSRESLRSASRLEIESPSHKRRSISDSLTSLFSRKNVQPHSPIRTPESPTHSPKAAFMEDSYWDRNVTRRSILNAVVLDEWLKELSSIAHLHALRLTGNTECL